MPNHAITLLDGGTGTELMARLDIPSHTTSIWSAQALIDAPEAVLDVHRDYIEAGADVVTVNNYSVTPPLLAREGIEDRLEELTLLAVQLARRARAESGRDVRIAGSVPPLSTSYRADLVGADGAIVADYRRIVGSLAPHVDVLLCETMASAREAAAAVSVAKETDCEVWVSWTLQGDRPDRLPSDETVAEAYAAVSHLKADAFLVNCCGANLVTGAMSTLAGLTNRPFGGYANSFDVPHGADQSASRPVDLHDVLRDSARPLDVEAYAESVSRWIDAGATIVGGCCTTGPAHIARLRRLIDG